MTTSTHKLKSSFGKVFPEYAKQLDKAKSQGEIKKLRKQFLAEAQANLAKALNKPIEKLSETDQTAPIALTKEQYNNLINATGDTIKNELHVILDGLARLKHMESDGNATVTAQIILSGVVSLGLVAYAAASSELVLGAVETVAALAGVTAATVALVCAIAIVVIVAILIPIIYFMEKPANCIVLLINELDDKIVFKNDYNIHGKPTLNTTPIPKAVVIPGVTTVATAGFIATEKKESALVGTQYGFTFTYKETELTFGVESPLTRLYVDNNCYCGIGISAKEAANRTNDKNVQSWEDSNDEIKISIKCNSKSGSIAYYVARAYKK